MKVLGLPAEWSRFADIFRVSRQKKAFKQEVLILSIWTKMAQHSTAQGGSGPGGKDMEAKKSLKLALEEY